MALTPSLTTTLVRKFKLEPHRCFTLNYQHTRIFSSGFRLGVDFARVSLAQYWCVPYPIGMHIRAHGVIVFTTTLSVTFRSNYAQFATASLLLGTSCCASNTHQRPIKVPRKSYFCFEYSACDSCLQHSRVSCQPIVRDLSTHDLDIALRFRGYSPISLPGSIPKKINHEYRQYNH